MLAEVLVAMGGNHAQYTPTETVTGVTIATGTAGACSGLTLATAATVAVSWSLTNVDATTYQLGVYKNGVLQTTLAGNATTYTDTIAGYVEGGTHNQFKSRWQYRIDVQTISDPGIVVSSDVSDFWLVAYGTCS